MPFSRVTPAACLFLASLRQEKAAVPRRRRRHASPAGATAETLFHPQKQSRRRCALAPLIILLVGLAVARLFLSACLLTLYSSSRR